MKRKLLIFSLLFMLCLCQIEPVYATKNTETDEMTSQENVIEITSAEDLLAFAEKCTIDYYSIGKVVELKSDISLLGIEFTGIPYFDGVFHGNGYTISGLYIEEVGSQLGFFRYIGDLGEVHDLTVKGNVIPSGSQTELGGIAGVNYGLIQNCIFEGNILGQEAIGGIAGTNGAFAKIINCSTKAFVQGTNRTGGIAGVNEGTIEGCTNESKVNIEELEPVLEVEGMDMGDLNMAQVLVTRNNTGGIAGRSSGLISNCTNKGTVGYEHVGYNVGGIAGTQKGVIKDSSNHGEVYGRKDVGGIVGQAEPYIESEYLMEKVEQMEYRTKRMQRTMEHMVESVEEIPNEMGITTEENGQINVEADWEQTETILKEKTEIMEADINSMLDQMESMTNYLSRMVAGMDDEIIEDVSSVKTAATMDGVITGCVNYGKVEGDINVAGIAGTMNIESQDDPELDVDLELDVSLESEINGVIISCTSYGNIIGKKDGIGAIIGLQELGLVHGCQGYGSIKANTGNYVGGIAGQSTAKIEKCYSVTDLSGGDYIGGIVGEGKYVADCLSIVVIDSTGECLGGIAGNVVEDSEIEDNFFVKSDYDGIDNISYAKMAEPMSFSDMMSLADIPEGFTQVTVTFVAEDEIIEEIRVPYGYELTVDKCPLLEDREDAYVEWPEEDVNTYVTNNITIEAEYIPWVQSIADNGAQPIFMAVGKFYEGTTLELLPETNSFPAGEGQNVLYNYAWTIQSERETVVEGVEGHFYVPASVEGEVQVWIAEGENWTPVETTVDGSYVVANIPYEAVFAVIEVEPDMTGTYLTIGAGVVVFILVISFVIVHNKRKKKAK